MVSDAANMAPIAREGRMPASAKPKPSGRKRRMLSTASTPPNSPQTTQSGSNGGAGPTTGVSVASAIAAALTTASDRPTCRLVMLSEWTPSGNADTFVRSRNLRVHDSLRRQNPESRATTASRLRLSIAPSKRSPAPWQQPYRHTWDRVASRYDEVRLSARAVARVEVGVLILGVVLRLYLAVVNREANDDHLSVIRIIAFQHHLPRLREAWEGFQPKLYHVSVAVLWNLSPWQSSTARVLIAQLVACTAGIATLFIVRAALIRRGIPPPVRLLAFA